MLTLALGLEAEGDLLKIARKTKTTFNDILIGDPKDLLRTANIFVRIIHEELSRPGTGHVYPSATGSGMHQASSPGEPPASDTEDLKNSIIAGLFGSGRTLFAGVSIDSSVTSKKKWESLEFGSKFMEPRPFIRPALRMGKQEMTQTYIKNSRKRIRRILRERRRSR